MDSARQRAVRERAEHRCEYCHFPETLAEIPFHVDHDLIARQLRERHDNRATLETEDEYDVQDLVHALLRWDFNDTPKGV